MIALKVWLESLRERIEAVAETRISDSNWQSRAGLHPIGRFVARRQARKLFDLVAGFTYSQTLVACESLGLFELLQGRRATAAELASATGTAEGALEQTLRAAVALGVLRVRRQHYALGPLGAALVGNPGVRAMIQHHRFLYSDLAAPEKLLGKSPEYGDMREYWTYAGREEKAGVTTGVAAYSELMASSQRFVADQILAAYDFSTCKVVLDLGGGYGIFIQALASRYPHLKFQLFDLPGVIAQAKAQLDAAGLANRVSFHGGDLFTDPLPVGADMVTMVRILHDHDDAAVTQVLPRVRQTLAPGAKLLVAEPMAGPAAKGVEAYFCNYFLAMGQGRLRTAVELDEFVRQAGFLDVRHVSPPIPMLVELLEALK